MEALQVETRTSTPFQAHHTVLLAACLLPDCGGGQVAGCTHAARAAYWSGHGFHTITESQGVQRRLNNNTYIVFTMRLDMVLNIFLDQIS